MPFRRRALFGSAAIDSTMGDYEDVYFALHGTKNFKGMVSAANLIAPGDTVFEIGANLGTETLALANLVGNRGRVIAVEADPRLAAILAARIADTPLRNITIVNRAAAASLGIVHVIAGAENLSGQTYVSDVPASDSVPVQTITADEMVREYGSPTFVFMDIEGSEYGFLSTATNLLSQVRPPIFTEVVAQTMSRSGGSIAQFCDIFSRHDYVAFDSDSRRFEQVDFTRVTPYVLGDWLLMPREKLHLVSRIRRQLLLARVMPRFRGLNPLETLPPS